MNSYYGMDRILKRYAGLEDPYQLKVALPHGPLADEQPWKPLVDANLPAAWIYPAHVLPIYERATQKLLLRASSPYLYLLRMVERPAAGARSGTIFFPAHSTRFLTAQMDIADIVRRLQELPDRFRPITVCVYWRDYMEGRSDDFVRAGFRIVSAGHMYDPDFLVRLHHLCSTHRYAASNSIGSHLFYSVKSGCSFFWLGSADASYTGTTRHLKEQYAPLQSRSERFLRRLFESAAESSTPRQTAVVNRILGAEHMMPPEALRDALLRLERPDAIGYIRRRSGAAPTLVFSPRLKRAYASGGRRLHRLVRWFRSPALSADSTTTPDRS